MGEKCNDPRCPHCGNLAIRGQRFIGRVVSDKMYSTVTVKWTYNRYVPKYRRYMKKSVKKQAHNPPCLNVKTGDIVEIAQCRPLSKTKSFVVVRKIK